MQELNHRIVNYAYSQRISKPNGLPHCSRISKLSSLFDRDTLKGNLKVNRGKKYKMDRAKSSVEIKFRQIHSS